MKSIQEVFEHFVQSLISEGSIPSDSEHIRMTASCPGLVLDFYKETKTDPNNLRSPLWPIEFRSICYEIGKRWGADCRYDMMHYHFYCKRIID